MVLRQLHHLIQLQKNNLRTFNVGGVIWGALLHKLNSKRWAGGKIISAPQEAEPQSLTVYGGTKFAVCITQTLA